MLKVSLLAILLIGMASAVPTADAPAEWIAQMENSNLISVTLTPEQPSGNQAWRMAFEFEEIPENATYRVCRVGVACYKTDVPFLVEGNTLIAAPFELEKDLGVEHVPGLYGIHIDFELNREIAGFPEGLEIEDPLFSSDYEAWDATHYVTFELQPAAKKSPSISPIIILLIGGALVVWRRQT